MRLTRIFRQTMGGDAGPVVVEGTIVEAPTQARDETSGRTTLVFRLDSHPDLEFRQELRPLAPDRRRGDRVRVHYHPNGDGSNVVEWIEKL